MSRSAENTAILETADREAAAMAQADMQAFEDVLTADATFLPPDLEPKTGDELRSWVNDFLRAFSVEWLSFEHGDVEADGSLGFHTYRYEWRLTPRVGGDAVIGRGKGMHIMRREANGKWRILREMWNALPVREDAR